MIMTGTPKGLTDRVRSFCRQISSTADPVFLPITPDPDSKPLECFYNVRQRVDRLGGNIQFGWVIWEWPNVLLQAEHHAIHALPNNGLWVDPTPPESTLSENNKITERLFLPDNIAVYDFDNKRIWKDNIRYAIVNDELVYRLFSNQKEITDTYNELPGAINSVIHKKEIIKIKALEQENQKICHDIAMKYTAQGAKCFCGSGIKFKNCHGERRKQR